MPWYDYLACFFSGMFLANLVPHFVHGVSGDPFPTPFAHPPGRGLSSPTVNVLWPSSTWSSGTSCFGSGSIQAEAMQQSWSSSQA
jgi:hypothetical protein